MSGARPAAALERAGRSDVAELLRLTAGESGRLTPAQVELEVESGRLWVLRSPGGLVAWCSVRWVADEVHVEDLEVVSAQRRRGWGGRLLALVMALARQRGASAALLEVRRRNAAARGLYRRAGFEVVGERRDYYREPADDAVLMRLRIAPDKS